VEQLKPKRWFARTVQCAMPEFIPCSKTNFFPTVEACNHHSYNQQLRNERLAYIISNFIATLCTMSQRCLQILGGDDLLGHYLGQGMVYAQWTRWTILLLPILYTICELLEEFFNYSATGNIIQVVTGVEVIIENVLTEVRKMLPQGRRPRATFCEPRTKNFQWWSMMRVSLCFVIPQNQNKEFKQKLFK